MFHDREDAGRRLAELLTERGVEADVVLAIPRGGLPLGREVTDALDAPLDVVAAKKLGAPHNPELAVGAAAADGSVWLNERMIDDLDVSDGYVEEETARAAERAGEKEETYREGGVGLDVEGKRVVVVDDGVATGATAVACLRRVREAAAEYLVFAAPVGASSSIPRLEREADDVFCVETPARFSAVGEFYEVFGQVSDEEAMTYL